jgi:hypothetical protein
MAKDGRALREEAAAATAAGKHKRALAAYLELERVEPRDAQWAKRAGETYRRLANNKHAIEAFVRSAERYAQNGFLVQAIAVCKVILQIDPNHEGTLERLARMTEQVGAVPTRAAGFAENNPALHDSPNVAAIRRASTNAEGADDAPVRFKAPDEPRARPHHSTPPVIAMSRTKSRPISLPPGAALDSVNLRQEVAASHRRDAGEPGIHVIPLDEDVEETIDYDRASVPVIEIEAPDDAIEPEVDEATELALADIEEIPLPEPRAIGAAAARALAATPLFAGLPSEALHALVDNLELVPLERGELLFREGDPGDALYVIAEGEVSVLAGSARARSSARSR